jgi:hypothetical protein
MNSPLATRAAINALYSRLPGGAPFLKGKLRQALDLLDDYEKTGVVFSLQWAVKFHQEVVGAIGARPPGKIEGIPF